MKKERGDSPRETEYSRLYRTTAIAMYQKGLAHLEDKVRTFEGLRVLCRLSQRLMELDENQSYVMSKQGDSSVIIYRHAENSPQRVEIQVA